MKKSFLTIAVLASVVGGASAQSSVTVYGIIDYAGVIDSGATQGKSVRVTSGAGRADRLGFKGTEDLGDGYAAAFTLETGFCGDSAAPVVTSVPVKNSAGATIGTTATSVPNFCTANNQFMGRQAHGDLSGAFGAISAGRVYSLGYLNLSAIDPFGAGYAGRVNNIVDASATRLNNALQYRTPNFSGFTGAVEASLGETTGNWMASREVGASGVYAKGPVYAGLTYYSVNNANGVDQSRRNWLLGGAYDFGVARLHGLVQKSDGSPTGAAKLDVLEWMFGASVPLASGTLMTSYVHHDDRSIREQDANQLGVGYNYPLSKRTSMYAAFARIIDRHGAPFLVGNQTDTGTGNKAFNLGVMHNF